MADIIKSGGVDAVLTAEPFVTRMTNAGLGSVGARYAAELARTDPIIFYEASREWAEKNAAAAAKSGRCSITAFLPPEPAAWALRVSFAHASPGVR